MGPDQLLGRAARWTLLAGAVLFLSLCVLLAVARPALASCTGTTCTAVVSPFDARFDLHSVPFSSASSADSTANSSISIQRSWTFGIGNFGPATVTVSYSATSPRTFTGGTPTPPPFTDSGTLTAGQTLRNTSQESAYALDTQVPGFASSRSVSPLAIPPGGTTQTLTATFTDDDASYNAGMEVLVSDTGAGGSWSFTSSSDPGDTTIVTPGPGPNAQIFLNNPVVGTTYTFTFTGTIPNATAQAFAYKPRTLFQFENDTHPATVYDSGYSLCDSVLNNGPCGSDNVTYSFGEAYEVHPETEFSSLVDYTGGTGPVITATPLTPGYWKNHLTSGTPNTNHYLPQTIGTYAVNSTTQATDVFNAMNCGNTSTGQSAIGCLAGQDLAAELNIANGSDPCINSALTKANAWLSGATEDGVPGISYSGPKTTYIVSKLQRSEAVSLMTPLSVYNAGGGC